MKAFLEKIEKGKITLALDFDGVIHQNSKGFFDGTIYDIPAVGTKESLKILSKNYFLIIYTCKAIPNRPLVNGKTGTELVWEWLKKYELDEYISEVTNNKPIALFYIDDKGIKFKNWEQTIKDIGVVDIVKK